MRLVFLAVFAFLACGLLYADDFSIKTSALTHLGTIPVLYTCDGKNVSPDLSWAHPPLHTQSFVLILSDPDAPNGVWYHWVVYNIPNTLRQISSSTLNGASVGKNSWNNVGYDGPCPPKGTAHHYVFTLYALDSKLTLPTDADAVSVENTLKGHVLKQTEITGMYSRKNL